MRPSLVPLVTAVTLILATAAACGDTSPATTVDPTPTETAQRLEPTPTAAPPQPTPSFISFEDSLSDADLAKYVGLSQELRDALDAESADNGSDSALVYLRVTPEDAPPIADLLTEEELTKFKDLDGPRQRQVLLEGYPNSSRRWEPRNRRRRPELLGAGVGR